MSKNRNITKAITPKGIAIYPKLNEPDTKFDADGVYEVKIALDADNPEAQAFMDKVNGIRDAFLQETKDALIADKKAARAAQLVPYDAIKPEVNEETAEETGRLIFKAKMKAGGTVKKGPRAGQPWSQKPDYFTAKGEKLNNPPRIGSGSVLKLGVELEPYLRETDKTVGVSIRLNGVQIITLKEGGGRSAESYGFGAEDGDDIADGEAQASMPPADGGGGSSSDDDI